MLLDEVLSDMRDSRALDDGMVDFLDALTEQAQASRRSHSTASPFPLSNERIYALI